MSTADVRRLLAANESVVHLVRHAAGTEAGVEFDGGRTCLPKESAWDGLKARLAAGG